MCDECININTGYAFLFLLIEFQGSLVTTVDTYADNMVYRHMLTSPVDRLRTLPLVIVIGEHCKYIIRIPTKHELLLLAAVNIRDSV